MKTDSAKIERQFAESQAIVRDNSPVWGEQDSPPAVDSLRRYGKLYFQPEIASSIAEICRDQMAKAEPKNDVERKAKEMATRLLDLADQNIVHGNQVAATGLLRHSIVLMSILGRSPLMMQAHSAFAALSGQEFIYRGKDSVFAPINERRRESALFTTIIYLSGDGDKTAELRGWDPSPEFQGMLDRSAAMLKKFAEEDAKRKAKEEADDAEANDL